MPNVRSKPAITNSSAVERRGDMSRSLGGVKPFGIELVQKREFLIGRRLGHPQMGSELQAKSGIVLKLFSADARVERHHLHAPLVRLETEHRQIGDHAERPAGE